MTFANDILSTENTLALRIRDTLIDARRQYKQHRMFRRTYNELSKLNERELDDLGISRSDIAQVARSSAYGN
ncbi:MAG: DUF1127 domain-containing protein [Rhodobacteraceae bacterium]|nr:DUF1127 domain-containing protein [Paracoccaceae bacterium]